MQPLPNVWKRLSNSGDQNLNEITKAGVDQRCVHVQLCAENKASAAAATLWKRLTDRQLTQQRSRYRGGRKWIWNGRARCTLSANCTVPAAASYVVAVCATVAGLSQIRPSKWETFRRATPPVRLSIKFSYLVQLHLNNTNDGERSC